MLYSSIFRKTSVFIVDKVSSHFDVSSELPGGEFHAGPIRRRRKIRPDQYHQTLRPAALHPVPAVNGEAQPI